VTPAGFGSATFPEQWANQLYRNLFRDQRAGVATMAMAHGRVRQFSPILEGLAPQKGSGS